MRRARSLFSFHGRSARLPYWQISIAAGLGAAVLVIMVMFMAMAGAALTAAAVLLAAPLFVVSLAVAVRRLHDRDKSGWWLLLFWLAPGMISAIAEEMMGAESIAGLALSLVSLGISFWALVEMGFLPGTPGPNRFGDDPKARVAVEVFD